MEANENKNKKIITWIATGIALLLVLLLGLRSCSFGKKDNPMVVATPQDNTSTPVSYGDDDMYFFFLKEEDAVGEVTYELIRATDEQGKNVAYFVLPDPGSNRIDVEDETPAGTYTLTIRVTAAGDDSYRQGVKDITYLFTIGKADTDLIAPQAISGLIYNGKPQQLVTPGSSQFGTIWFRLGEDGEWTTEVPQATDAGVYTVYYKVEGDANHKDIKETSLLASINRQGTSYRASYTASSVNGSGIISYIKDNTSPVRPVVKKRSAIKAPNTFVEYTYDGSVHGNGYGRPQGVIVVGEVEGTNAGTYTAIYTPDANHCWPDGTYGPIRVTLVINKKDIGAKPEDLSVIYNGETQTNGYEAPEGVIVVGEEKGADVGTYVAIYTPDQNHCWDDGTNTPVSVTLRIDRKPVGSKPLDAEYTYDGEEHGIIYDLPEGVTIEGVVRAVDAGVYEADFTPDANHCWDDGTTDTVHTVLTIHKAEPTVEVNVKDLIYNGHYQQLFGADDVVVEGGRISYSLSGWLYSPSIPQARDAGTYTVYYKVEGDSNHLDYYSAFSVRILKKQLAKPTTASGFVYNGLLHTADIEGYDRWTMHYDIFNSTFSAISAGTYKITVVLDDPDNYEWEDGSSEPAELYWTIAKAPGRITRDAQAKDLVYNGSEQQLVTPAMGTGRILYRVDDGEFSTALPVARNAGTYTVEYYTEETANYAESEHKFVEVTIEKAQPRIVSYPQGVEVFFNFTRRVIVEPGVSPDGLFYYRLEGSEEWTLLPRARDVKEYKIYWKFVGDANHKDIDEDADRYVTSAIVTEKQAEYLAYPEARDLTYNGSSQRLLEPGLTLNGTVVYCMEGSDSWSWSIPSRKEAGTYYVESKILGAAPLYYDSYKIIIEVTIREAQLDISAPNQIYSFNGEAQGEPIRVVTVDGTAASIEYKVGNGEWSETAPTLTDVGSINVTYRAAADNHAGAEGRYTLTVEKAQINVDAPDQEYIYNGTAQGEPISTMTADGSEAKVEYRTSLIGRWSQTVPQFTNVRTTLFGSEDSYIVYYRVTAANHETVTGSYEVTIHKKAYPKVRVESALVYNGEVQNVPLLNFEENAMTISGRSSAADAGEYRVTIALKDRSNTKWEDDTTASYSLNWLIEKASVSLEDPQPIDGLVYTGQPQQLISAGSAEGGTLQYSSDGVNFSNKIPSGIDDGEYEVCYRVVADRNHIDTAVITISNTIAKADIAYSIADQSYVYDGKAHGEGLSDITSVDGSAVRVEYVSEDYAGEEVPQFTEVKVSDEGEVIGYEVTFRLSAEHHKDVEGSYKVTIKKAPGIMENKPEATTEDLTYTGKTYVLLKVKGISSTGSVLYSLNGSEYSGEIPAASDAGEYVISYYAKGDQNHADTEVETLRVIINKAAVVDKPTIDESTIYYLYDGEEHGPTISYNEELVEVSGTSSAANAGEYSIEFRLKDGKNYCWSDNTEGEVRYLWTIGKSYPSLNGDYPDNMELNYSGQAQKITYDLTAQGGTVVYGLDGFEGEFSDEIYKTDPGAYIVYYMIRGDQNHYDVEVGNYIAVIREPDITKVELEVESYACEVDGIDLGAYLKNQLEDEAVSYEIAGVKGFVYDGLNIYPLAETSPGIYKITADVYSSSKKYSFEITWKIDEKPGGDDWGEEF